MKIQSLHVLIVSTLPLIGAAQRRPQRLRHEYEENSDNELQIRSNGCPCQSLDLCKPISGPPVRPGGELFGFSSPTFGSLEIFNWTYISTIAWASDDLLCEAHRHGTRLVASTAGYDLNAFVNNSTARSEWIDSTLSMIQARHFDGVTFDYEDPIESADAPLAQTYVALVRETKERFAQVNPSYQVSVCVAWSPDGIDGRNYPIKQLSDASDLLYVMDYDTQSQIFDAACMAGANGPYYGMIHGMNRYFSLGIPARKLILGVPWYGYRYPCLVGTTQLEDRYCPIKHVPFRGVPCSDAAGQQIPFLKIQAHLLNNATTTTTLRRDDNMVAPYFNEVGDDNSTIYQYWFDDAESLRHKFVWARSAGLAGVGPYTFVDLDPALDPHGILPKQPVLDLWSAFDGFFLDGGLLPNNDSSITELA